VNFRRSVINAKLWRPEIVARRETFEKFLRFLEKRPPYGKNFQNYVPKVFIVTPIDVLCSNFVKFGRREIGEIVRCLHDNTKTKFRLALQLSLLRGSRPMPGASPRKCTQSALDFIQVGSLSAKLQPNV